MNIKQKVRKNKINPKNLSLTVTSHTSASSNLPHPPSSRHPPPLITLAAATSRHLKLLCFTVFLFKTAA